MPNNDVIAALSLQVGASTVKLRTEMDAAGQSMRKFGAEARAQTTEARAGIKQLGEEIGIGLNRHLVSFLAKLPGVAPLMAAAFPAAAVIGIGMAFVESGKRLVEFINTARDAASKINEGFASIHQASKMASDEMAVSNDKIQQQMAKLSGKQVNGLALMLDESRLAADKLLKSLLDDNKALDDLMQKNQVKTLAALLTGQQATGSTQDFLQAQARTLVDIAEKYQSLADAAKTADEAQAIKAQGRLELLAKEKEQLFGLQELYNYQKSASETRGGALYGGLDISADQGLIGGRAHQLQDMIRGQQLSFTNADSTAQLKLMEIGAEEARKKLEADLAILKNMTEHGKLTDALKKQGLEASMPIPDDVSSNKVGQEMMEDQYRIGDRWKEYNAALSENALIHTRLDSALKITNLHLEAEAGLITKQQAALRAARLELTGYQNEADEVRSQMRGVAGDSSLGNVQQATQLARLQNKLDQITGQATIKQAEVDALAKAAQLRSAMGTMFSEWIQRSTDLKSQFTALWDQFSSSMNDQMAKAVLGQKTNWSKAFLGIGETATKFGFSQVEGQLLPRIPGLGGLMKSVAPRGTPGNPMYVKVVGDGGAGSGPGGVSPAGSPGGAFSWGSSGSTAASAMSGMGGIVGSMGGVMSSLMNAFAPAAGSGAGDIVSQLAAEGFGGAMAMGGPVLAGVSYDVGEMGREKFVPHSNGSIIPNHAVRDGGAFYEIHVGAGASAAEVKQYIDSALTRVHGSAVANSIAVQRERMRRSPTRA